MAEPEVQPETTMMEKIYGHHHRSESSGSSDADDKSSKKEAADGAVAVKAKAEEDAAKPKTPQATVKSDIFRIFGREKPVHKVLGGGKPADVLLWRNKKISGSVLAGATVLWVFFECLQYHLITLVCHILILSLTVFFLWSSASSFINKAPPQIPKVQLPEQCVLELAAALRNELNKGFLALRDLALGKDVKTFLGVIAVLWIVSVIGKWFNFLTLVYFAFVLLHTVPVIYENYDDQIDALAEKGWIELKKQYAVFDAKVLSKIPMGPVKEKKKD